MALGMLDQAEKTCQEETNLNLLKKFYVADAVEIISYSVCPYLVFNLQVKPEELMLDQAEKTC